MLIKTILTHAETGHNQETVQTTVVNGTLIANPDQIPSHAEPRTWVFFFVLFLDKRKLDDFRW